MEVDSGFVIPLVAARGCADQHKAALDDWIAEKNGVPEFCEICAFRRPLHSPLCRDIATDPEKRASFLKFVEDNEHRFRDD